MKFHTEKYTKKNITEAQKYSIYFFNQLEINHKKYYIVIASGSIGC